MPVPIINTAVVAAASVNTHQRRITFQSPWITGCRNFWGNKLEFPAADYVNDHDQTKYARNKITEQTNYRIAENKRFHTGGNNH